MIGNDTEGRGGRRKAAWEQVGVANERCPGPQLCVRNGSGSRNAEEVEGTVALRVSPGGEADRGPNAIAVSGRAAS